MRKVVFGALAQHDLQQAWDYIAADSVRAADRLRERIHHAVDLLAQMPGIGHRRPDVPESIYRFWTVRPYVIGYRYTSRSLTIVRVVHGARDFREIF